MFTESGPPPPTLPYPPSRVQETQKIQKLNWNVKYMSYNVLDLSLLKCLSKSLHSGWLQQACQ